MDGRLPVIEPVTRALVAALPGRRPERPSWVAGIYPQSQKTGEVGKGPHTKREREQASGGVVARSLGLALHWLLARVVWALLARISMSSSTPLRHSAQRVLPLGCLNLLLT